ncbi:MupG family TIM beta-alpha barrel fold protein [Anaerosalibacter massiliensis]|uniref:MupG family TIM beta-alpha barrel fold protein n=1 Tax=Anaerosalibacter massiliensis TaxID=1347392 RepID=A0A9X2MLH1_9FIRM|nr:MupG family TIM beta-alpha barrel fold protein [Anaerosalibacter massiliensis]MCR2045342.1 MupG family TIM beta-alpha barrel fold protein [Anaerosalibacter massiliensis]
MKNLGISVYPEKSTDRELLDYIDMAKDVGFKRIFSCLLSVQKSKDEIVHRFSNIIGYANKKGFETIVDVNPSVLKKLKVDGKDLSFFKDIKASGFRLDGGYSGCEEAMMTYNDYNLKIEINMSNDTRYIDTIMDHMPNRYNLMGCHNFYPHKHTGLSLDYFKKCTNNFKKYGLNTAAFITSQNDNAFGPWPIGKQIPTLEMHRYMPIEVQLKHMIALNDIDDIIISNCFATEEEFLKIKNMRLDMVSFEIIFEEDITEIEKAILLDEIHFRRGDVSDTVIRSTKNSRDKYGDKSFPIHNVPKNIKRGDVLIESDEYGNYKGELEIALKDFENSGKSNVVARIKEEEIFILDFIKPNQKFNFIIANN